MAHGKHPPLFSAPWLRVLACIFGALIATTVITSGATTYFPMNEIDRIGVPILLFPVVWTLLLLFSALVKNIWMVWGTLLGLVLVHSLLIYFHLTGG